MINLIKDEKGSALPFISIILILIILVGVVNYALVVMYRDRTSVRDALDAGVTSSLVAHIEEKQKALYYGETLSCRERNWIMPCRKRVCTNRDSEGHCTNYKWVYWKERVCSLKAWKNTKSNFKNYIYLDKEDAEKTAREYIEENLKLNNLEGRAKILSLSYEVTYDDKRTYTVVKKRDLTRSFVTGVHPSKWNNPGTPDQASSQYREGGKLLLNNPLWNEYDGETWWKVEFKGAYGADGTMDKLTNPPDWNSSEAYEEREDVYFPRWVEIKAKATVELPVPFGTMLGKETYTAEFETTGFKELIEVIE